MRTHRSSPCLFIAATIGVVLLSQSCRAQPTEPLPVDAWLRAPVEFDVWGGADLGWRTVRAHHTLAFRESDDRERALVDMTMLGPNFHVCSWSGIATREDAGAYLGANEGDCRFRFQVASNVVRFLPSAACAQDTQSCGALARWYETGFPRTVVDAPACVPAYSSAGDAQQGLPACALSIGEPTLLAQADGLVLETRSWWTPQSHGTAWHVSAPLPSDVSVAAHDGPVEFETLLPSGGTWGAINGGFYDQNLDPMGVVVSNGVVQNPYTGHGGSGVLEVDDAGTRIVHHSEYEPGARHALQSIDRLVDAGRNLVRREHDEAVAARAGVAISDDRIHLVVVTGHNSITGEGSEIQLERTGVDGLTLWAFAEYLRLTCDANEALNLDGGVSAQMAAMVGGTTLRVGGVSGTPNAVVVRVVPSSAPPVSGTR